MKLPVDYQFEPGLSTERLNDILFELGQEHEWTRKTHMSIDPDTGESYYEDPEWGEYSELLVEEADKIEDELFSRKINKAVEYDFSKKRTNFAKIDINIQNIKAGL